MAEFVDAATSAGAPLPFPTPPCRRRDSLSVPTSPRSERDRFGKDISPYFRAGVSAGGLLRPDGALPELEIGASLLWGADSEPRPTVWLCRLGTSIGAVLPLVSQPDVTPGPLLRRRSREPVTESLCDAAMHRFRKGGEDRRPTAAVVLIDATEMTQTGGELSSVQINAF